MSENRWYYYLHKNGDIIGKNPVAVEYNGAADYFDSPFVIDYWCIDTKNRQSLIEFLDSVKKRREEVSNKDKFDSRISEIETKSSVTDKDYECLRRIKNGEPYDKVLAEVFK